MSRQAESRKLFEWRVRFLVEGAFTSNLPRIITEECILEKFEQEKGIHDKAILGVRVCRSSIPSEEEVKEVEKLAYEKAQKAVNLYSLFLGLLRIVRRISVVQVTPFEKKLHRLVSATTTFTISIQEKVWVEGVKSLERIGSSQFEEYISLALSHYNLASWAEPKSRFLNLMICMEALYNTEPQELRYRMSHRVANLLGRTEEMRQRIFNDFLFLYGKRNELAHGLKSVKVSNDDNQLLLLYAKCSLFAFLKLGQKKKNVLDEIDNAVYDTKARNTLQDKCKDAIEALEMGYCIRGRRH